MSGPSDRRGFLRGLVSLPLIGGGVTLIGSPMAVAAPITHVLLEEYADWLTYELSGLMRERFGEDNPRASQEWRARFGRAFDWHRARGPLIRDSNGHPMGDGVSFPSTRAALVLATVGCDWREGGR